jgi:hypothetical protein
VNPHLVMRDKNGGIYTMRYEAVNAMLLNPGFEASSGPLHRKIRLA